MSSDQCVICEHDYDIINHKPLVLPCSHSFRKDCLTQLESTNNKNCPLCRSCWSDTKVKNLVLCRQLIWVIDAKSKAIPVLRMCVKHECEVLFWCHDCKVTMCKKCTISDHRVCRYVLIETKNAHLLTKLNERANNTHVFL